MMGTKHIALLLALLTSGLAAASDVRYAIVRLDGAGHGVLIADAPLDPGSTVDIQYPLASQGAACCKRLTSSDFVRRPAGGIVATNEVTGDQPMIFDVRVPKLWAQVPFVGMAAIGKAMTTRNAGSKLVSVDERGRARRASLCISQEGVHVVEMVRSSERTHLYLSLGYEVESPTCR